MTDRRDDPKQKDQPEGNSLGAVMNKKWLVYGALVLVGAMASGKILALPGLNKLPRF